MSSRTAGDDTEIMTYIKRRRAINRRAAAKSRARLRQRATHAKQMYYEARSINTRLVYQYRQLEQVRETLEAAWTEHKRLHQAAGVDVSEVSCSPRIGLQTNDVLSSSICQSARDRRPSFYQSVPHQSDDPVVSRSPKALGTCTSKPVCAAYADTLDCNDPLSVALQRRLPGREQSVVSKWPTNVESSECRTAKQEPEVRQQSFPRQPSQPLDYSCSSVLESQSAVFDEDCSTSRSNDDDDDLGSLFGDDDWWPSEHQSWSWQCSTPDSPVDEPGGTTTESRSATCAYDSFSSLMSDTNYAAASVNNFQFQQRNSSIPLHVAGLVDDSQYIDFGSENGNEFYVENLT